jgi:hypothetical protein
MNTIAILPKLCMKTLQRQNTKREIVKKVRFSKNIADADSGTLKKYAPKPKTATAILDNKDNKEDAGSAVPVAASDSQTSLDTTSVINTVAETVVDTVAESGGKSQHENAITLSLTE